MTYKDDSSRMGLTECALECFLLHVPCSLSVWILLFFFVFVQASLSSVTGHTVLVCSLGLPAAVFSVDSFISFISFPLSVPTRCDVCGSRGGCSLPPSPGD